MIVFITVKIVFYCIVLYIAVCVPIKNVFSQKNPRRSANKDHHFRHVINVETCRYATLVTTFTRFVMATLKLFTSDDKNYFYIVDVCFSSFFS